MLAQEIGADGLELVITPLVLKTGLEKVKKLSQQYNLPIYNVHQPPWYVLFTGRGKIRKMVGWAKFLEAQNLVAHLATMRRTFNSPFFEWIKEIEQEQGLNIAFENAAPRKLEKFPRYAGHPKKLEKFVQKRKINLTFDVAKAVLAGIDPYQFFQRNHSQIKVVHLHGFKNGDFHIGFKGHDFDWSGFLSFVKKFNYTGAVTLEIFPIHKWFYFNLPQRSELDRAKDIIRENFALLKRA